MNAVGIINPQPGDLVWTWTRPRGWGWEEVETFETAYEVPCTGIMPDGDDYVIPDPDSWMWVRAGDTAETHTLHYIRSFDIEWKS